MVIFQPPDISSAQPPAAAGRRKAPAEAPEPVAEDSAESQPQAQAQAQAGADTEDGSETGSRRRRRGGRGHGKTRGSDDAAETADQSAGQAAAQADESADASAGGPDQSGDDSEGTGGRRRRRRRRSGSGGDGTDTPDDPPNTVVHVRAPRSAATTTTDVTDVRAVRGSTRLEAKRQRRREGRESGRRRPPIITESEFLARREAVSRVMVVRQRGDRTQIAVMEDGILVEHYVDKASSQAYVGNVYLGKVQNVLPSMEAAFVDIGKGRNAVLYAGEVNFDASGLEGESKRTESALKSGQSILVQVTKDPIGHKGARLTSQVSLPGRYLVYVPGASMTGISRKLPDTERARLKAILKQVMPEGAGVIVRTAAEGASEEELARDVSRLAAQWESIERKAKTASAPELLYSEPDLTIRVVRDIFNEDFTKLVIDSDGDWDLVDEYVRYVAPHLAERMERWTDDGDVFASYRIDEQLGKALERKVWLPSGGSLVIDNTEAMTVIDVNTGKFTGQGGNLEQTVTRNNLEAAEEIVRQLRLRDVGGIIVIDFIDMVLESNRDLVLRRLLECLARDRTKHQVAEVTSLGLVQMTRKRVGSGLLEAFSVTCEHCNGRGVLVSMEPVDHAHTRSDEDGRGRDDGKSRGRGSRNGRQGRNGNGRAGSSGSDDSPARDHGDGRDSYSSRDDTSSREGGSGRDRGSGRDGGAGRDGGSSREPDAARDALAGGAYDSSAGHEASASRDDAAGREDRTATDGATQSNGAGPRRVARAVAVRAAGPPDDVGDARITVPPVTSGQPGNSGPAESSGPGANSGPADSSGQGASSGPADTSGPAASSGPADSAGQSGGAAASSGAADGSSPAAASFGPAGQDGTPAGANGGEGGADSAAGSEAAPAASGGRRRRGRSRSQAESADTTARPANTAAATVVADRDDRNS